MKPAETSLTFAGLDGRTNARLPEWYAAATDTTEWCSFAEAIRQLPRAVETRVAFQNLYTDEWVETERFNALVEPSRLIDHGDEEAVDPLFHIPTQSYSIINPTDVYDPFESVLAETEYDGRALGEVVFGQIRQYRDGGEVHMDVLFDGLSVDLPGRTGPITMGITSGYDFFGGHAVYAEGFARDTVCANSIRQVTDRRVVKHVGDVGSFDAWWRDILDGLELLVDDLFAFIIDAQEITIDFREVPFDLAAFYELLGLPSYLAEHAASDARTGSDNPFEVDLWTLHSGATYALTHFFQGKEGDALDGYVRIANDVLFNPEVTIERVEDAYERAADEETGENGQTGLSNRVALAQLKRVSQDVREKATQFEEREAVLRDRFAE
jgi:hypothetical protein